MTRHYLKVADLTKDEVLALIESARASKGERSSLLSGKTLGLIFSKPSTRTRVSFTVAAYHLGGRAIFLSEREMQLGRGETIEDTARVLSGYLNGVVIRTFSQVDLEAFAAAASIPVINGLTDERHPSQALADLMTISEYAADLSKVKVVYLGDGNNVAVSLTNILVMVGAHIVVCTPPELELPSWAVSEAEALAAAGGGVIEILEDPAEAVRDADFLYTDVWFSMGQQKVPEKRKMLEPYQIDQRLLDLAKPGCRVMHCLPAHRGEEISAEVMDGPQSIVFPQAENRLHSQKELLKLLIGDAKV
ncbi:MAG: ornithine carbamoyltransferase [Actinobacteria bacterium]|nr:ornithine carbamoyltransferase [Actinomycetota bacterium]